jgi:hypothetical protein
LVARRGEQNIRGTSTRAISWKLEEYLSLGIVLSASHHDGFNRTNFTTITVCIVNDLHEAASM